MDPSHAGLGTPGSPAGAPAAPSQVSSGRFQWVVPGRERVARITGQSPFATPRRVLHVAQPPVDGVAEFVDQVSSFQADRGWDVHVAGPRRPRNEQVHWHQWHSVRSPIRGVLSERAALNAIRAEVTPEVVVLHSAKAGLVGRLAVRGRIPTVYVPHAWSFLSQPAGWAMLATWWERAGARWTNATVLVSAGEAEIGMRRGIRAPQFVVENPVPAGWLERPVVDPAGGRAALGLPAAPTAVAVARLCRQKGIDVLLGAWHQLISQPGAGSARLVVVGDGPDRTRLESLADGSVTFVGAVADPGPWLAAAEVFVLPSRWEGLSLAMLEAMAVGRAVVTTDVAGSEVVSRSRGGQVVPVESVAELAGAVARRLADPALARAEGARARAYVAAFHQPDAAYEAFSAALARAHAFGMPSRAAADR